MTLDDFRLPYWYYDYDEDDIVDYDEMMSIEESRLIHEDDIWKGELEEALWQREHN